MKKIKQRLSGNTADFPLEEDKSFGLSLLLSLVRIILSYSSMFPGMA